MIRGTLSGSKLSLCILVAAAFSGCTSTKPRTQVMLVVDADPDVVPKTTALRVEVDGRTLGTEAYEPLSDQTYPPVESDGMTWPYKVALIPRSGDEQREFRITATAYNGNDAIARVRAESGFVPRKTIALELRFQLICLYAKSLNCLQTETCLDGACVPSRIDQATLPNYTEVPDVNIPVGDGGPGMITNAVMGGSGGASGSGVAVGTGGTAGGPDGDPGNCGDGKLTGDEKCDTAIPEMMAGACPKACQNASACEPARLEGSGCQTHCQPYKITAFDSMDGCCPDGGDANSDPDCRSTCGNGTIETGEACDPVETCPTPATCVSLNPCLKAVIVGDAAACTAQCTMVAIMECIPGDGCCPGSCTNGNDSDCSASCGDGIVQPPELCELNSTERPCVTSCNDDNACTEDLAAGSAEKCSASCTMVPITAPKRDDGCCPNGGNANNDNDCQAKCGNNIVESGERCDGRCPTAANCNDFNPCTVDALTGSGCNVACTHELIVLPANSDGCCPALIANANNDNDCNPVCGNAVVENGEQCDGNCPESCPDDGNACTRNEVSGTRCSRRCVATPLNVPTDGKCCSNGRETDCPAVCGNGNKEGTEECDDGNIANNDGCSSACRNEHCGDNVKQTDEDCDGNCTTACNDGNACTADSSASCKCSHIPLSTPTDGKCCSNGNEVACPVVCGNGTKETGEGCDDGNKINNDGCSSTCEVEMCGDGTTQPPREDCDGNNCSSVCNDGNACTSDSDTNCKCTHTNLDRPQSGGGCCSNGREVACPAVCGNGNKEGTEECDDGNTSNNDGCSSTCKTERCGDGIKQPGEDCEGDCGTVCNDDNACTADSSTNCKCGHSPLSKTPSGGCCVAGQEAPCPTVCGDGTREGPEECDDGNTMSGDGCSASCMTETLQP